MGNPRFL